MSVYPSSLQMSGSPPRSDFWEDPHLSQSETPEMTQMRAQMELLPEESPRGDSNLGNLGPDANLEVVS